MKIALRLVILFAFIGSPGGPYAQTNLDDSPLARILAAPSDAPAEDEANDGGGTGSGDSTGVWQEESDSPKASPFAGPALPEPRVCIALPLTGVHAPLGNRLANRMADELDQGPGIEVVRLDTQGTRAGAEAAASRADSEGCTLLLGGIGDREAVALADGAVRVGMPAIVLGGAPDTRVRDRVIWARADRLLRARTLARHLADAGIVTVWLLAVDSPYGNAERQAFEQVLPMVGVQIGAAVGLPTESAELAASAAAVAERVRTARSGNKCTAEAFILIHDVPGARRLLGFLQFEGLLEAPNARCPAPLVAGPALWLEGPALSRTRALDGAFVAGVRVRGAESDLLEAEALDATDLVLAALEADPNPPRTSVIPVLRALPAQPARTGSLQVSGDRVIGKDILVFVIRRGVPEPAVDPTEAEWTNSD